MGAAFGFLVAAARLSDYQVIHDMLLREPDVFLLGFRCWRPLRFSRSERRRIQTMFGGELTMLRQPVTRRRWGLRVSGAGRRRNAPPAWR
jgi:hypothetical protein